MHRQRGEGRYMFIVVDLEALAHETEKPSGANDVIKVKYRNEDPTAGFPDAPSDDKIEPNGTILLPNHGPMALYLTNPCTWFYDGYKWHRV